MKRVHVHVAKRLTEILCVLLFGLGQSIADLFVLLGDARLLRCSGGFFFLLGGRGSRHHLLLLVLLGLLYSLPRHRFLRPDARCRLVRLWGEKKKTVENVS